MIRIPGLLVTTFAAVLLQGTASTWAHENDPKGKPEPPIYGDIIYGNQNGIAGGGWPGSQENTIFCAQIPINQLGGSGNGSDC